MFLSQLSPWIVPYCLFVKEGSLQIVTFQFSAGMWGRKYLKVKNPHPDECSWKISNKSKSILCPPVFAQIISGTLGCFEKMKQAPWMFTYQSWVCWGDALPECLQTSTPCGSFCIWSCYHQGAPATTRSTKWTMWADERASSGGPPLKTISQTPSTL